MIVSFLALGNCEVNGYLYFDFSFHISCFCGGLYLLALAVQEGDVICFAHIGSLALGCYCQLLKYSRHTKPLRGEKSLKSIVVQNSLRIAHRAISRCH